MPTIEDVTKILSEMDENSYYAAVRFIYYLASDSYKNQNERMIKQKRFVEETAGKIEVDENAVNNLRMGCMI